MLWFTADTHFGHEKIIGYCSRPFSSGQEMDQVMIHNWNRVVGKDDVVFHLGDLGNPRMTIVEAKSYVEKLNGQIHVIPGNHDTYWAALGENLMSCSGFSVRVLPPEHEIKIGDRPIVLAHYAMRVWNRSYHGAGHLYGHSHGRLPEWGLSMDVGVDCHNFTPISEIEVMSQLTVYEKTARLAGGEGFLRFESLSQWTQEDKSGKVGS